LLALTMSTSCAMKQEKVEKELSEAGPVDRTAAQGYICDC